MERGDASPEGAPQGTSGEAAAPGGVPGYAGVRAVLGRCNMRNLLKFYARVTHQASLASGLFVERGDLVDALVKCLAVEGIHDSAGTVVRLHAASITLVEHTAPPVVDLTNDDEDGAANASDGPAGSDTAGGHRADGEDAPVADAPVGEPLAPAVGSGGGGGGSGSSSGSGGSSGSSAAADVPGGHSESGGGGGSSGSSSGSGSGSGHIVFTVGKSPSHMFMYMSEDVSPTVISIMFHFFAERAPSEGFALPEGVDASGGILKICASAMSGVNRRALVVGLWVRLRSHAGSAELRAVTCRKGGAERMVLAPGGARAGAQELLLL